MFQSFGEYLVQQGILSPDHYRCLVGQAADAVVPVAVLAVERNMLTIGQASTVREFLEMHPRGDFLDVAVQMDFLDPADAVELRHQHQLQGSGLENVLVELQQMTRQQANVLREHYQRLQASKSAETAAANTSTTDSKRADQKFPPPKFQQRIQQRNPVAQAADNRYSDSRPRI